MQHTSTARGVDGMTVDLLVYLEPLPWLVRLHEIGLQDATWSRADTEASGVKGETLVLAEHEQGRAQPPWPL